MSFSLPFMWLLCHVLSLPLRAKPYWLVKESACVWFEIELAFKKVIFFYGFSKIFNIFYDSFSFKYLGNFSKYNKYFYYVNVNWVNVACSQFELFGIFCSFGWYMMGQLFVVFFLTVVDVEFVIRLTLLVITFWICKTIVVDFRATIYIAYNHCLNIWKIFVVLF
jgi:hypothetical protein